MKIKLFIFQCLLLLSFSSTDCGEPHIYFHGSSANFSEVEPRPSQRITDGVVVWDGEAIFATPDFRIALFYTHNRTELYWAGVDLITEIDSDTPLTFTLYGPNSLEETLDALYGVRGEPSSKGFIYLLDSSYFFWMQGLGSMERISTNVDANIGKMEIDRRKLIDHFIKTGKVEIQWLPVYP